jgi:acyl-CoA synthetase (AMP-forming)/AMP-acid ligase II
MDQPGSPSTEQFNLATVSEVVADTIPDRTLIAWGDRRWSYGEVAERSRRLASYLHSQGLGCHTERADLAGHEVGQDMLGIYGYNGNEWLEAMLGSFKARVAPFNVNYRYVREELRYLLADAGATAMVYQAAFAPLLAEVRDDLPDLRVLIQIDDGSGTPLLDGAVDYEAALAEGSPAGPSVAPSPDDLYVLYTGGTTGMPKGVLWRQHDIFVSAMGGRQIGTWELLRSYDEIRGKVAASGESSIMILPPMMHGAAQWGSFASMSGGSTLVFPRNVERLDPVDVLRTVEEHRVMIMMSVGDAMARPLVEELERGGYDISSLFAFANGGAPLTAAIKERLIEQQPGLLVTDGVGSSETGAQMAHVSVKGAVGTGTFKPSPDTVVIDADLTRLEVPGHEDLGWLGQGGPVPLGYKGDPDKTARTFPVIDGTRYAIPGDRARLLADGGIELLGRDSVTINSGGEKIFAEEVEMAIASHPAIKDVVVAGRPSERWGQEVVAIVALAEAGAATADELVEHAATTIARYKLPKLVVFRDEIQRSPSGKADYRWAKAQAEAG